MKVRTRFAPSPTGFLHIGNVYSALLDFAFARKHRGKFILRIEDTDLKRYVKGAEEKIYRWLKWLGIEPDEGPQKGGPYGPYRQSERLSLYRRYAEELVQKGKAYYCFCSPERLEKVRKEKQKQGLPPMYDRHCRRLSLQEAKERIKKGEKYVIRMKIPDREKIVVSDLIRGEVVFDSRVVDDQVLIKSDGYPTYHLAVVVDDHLMKITHVIRGEDWLSSAPKHFLLYRYFGWQPPVFVHTAIIRNPDKSKMSKRQGHASLQWYIDEGYLPEALINFLCLLGWSHPQEKEIFSLSEFIKYFKLQDLSSVGPVFDLRKLDWMNGVYIRQKSDQALVQLIKPFAPRGMSDTLIKQTIPLVKERMRKLAEYPDLVDFLVKEPKVEQKLLIKKGADKETIKKQLKISLASLEKVRSWQAAVLEKLLRGLAEKYEWHRGKYLMMLRICLTGRTVTPPLFETMALLGREKTLRRIEKTTKEL